LQGDVVSSNEGSKNSAPLPSIHSSYAWKMKLQLVEIMCKIARMWLKKWQKIDVWNSLRVIRNTRFFFKQIDNLRIPKGSYFHVDRNNVKFFFHLWFAKEGLQNYKRRIWVSICLFWHIQGVCTHYKSWYKLLETEETTVTHIDYDLLTMFPRSCLCLLQVHIFRKF
jgi:hypothetical protein